METVGSYQVKTHISRLLDRVSQGAEFVITRRGVPIAKLTPISFKENEMVLNTIKKMEAFQKEHTLNGLTIQEMIREGRK